LRHIDRWESNFFIITSAFLMSIRVLSIPRKRRQPWGDEQSLRAPPPHTAPHDILFNSTRVKVPIRTQPTRKIKCMVCDSRNNLSMRGASDRLHVKTCDNPLYLGRSPDGADLLRRSSSSQLMSHIGLTHVNLEMDETPWQLRN
jgi:hypothetical protein